MRRVAPVVFLFLGFCLAFSQPCRAINDLAEAKSLAEAGEYEKAKTMLEQLAENDKDDSEVMFELGKAWYFLADYKKATSSLEKAIKIQPDSAKYHLWLGHSFGALTMSGSKLKAMFRARKVPDGSLRQRHLLASRSTNPAQLAIYRTNLFLEALCAAYPAF